MPTTRVTLISIAILLIVRAAIAAPAPTTVPTADSITAGLAPIVSKAEGHSVLLVLRAGNTGAPEHAASAAKIRTKLVEALKAAGVNSSACAFTQQKSPIPPVVNDLPAKVRAQLLAASGCDLQLMATLSVAGKNHDIQLQLSSATQPAMATSRILASDATLADPAAAVAWTDLEAAGLSIKGAIGESVRELLLAAAPKGIKTVYVLVRPAAIGDGKVLGLEQELCYTAMGANPMGEMTLKDFADLKTAAALGRIGPLNADAIAKVKELPSDAAVLVLVHFKCAGGQLVRLTMLTGSADLGSNAGILDDWDCTEFPDTPRLNSLILTYAEKQRGTKVGNGQCWTLAAEALKVAGAQPPKEYTFGHRLAKDEPVLPGDVMQFESVRLEGRRGNTHWWMNLGNPHHTAIVRRVLGPTEFEILGQNPNPVESLTINFRDLKSGTYEVYRAAMKE